MPSACSQTCQRSRSRKILLYSHGLGLAVNLEREALARAGTGLSDEQWVDAQAPALRQLADRFPNFARMIGGLPASGYDFDLDALFETGLRALLDGFGALIERESGARPPPRRPGS
jgi:hypothetical protein